MARPYVVKFPQSPASYATPTAPFHEGVIAPSQALIAGQNLILNYLTPDTIPVMPKQNLDPFPSITQNDGPVMQPVQLGQPVTVPGGSRSIIIVAGAVSLANISFTVTGVDQFNNPLVSGPTVGPAANAAIEFQTIAGTSKTVGFDLFFHRVDSISFTGVPSANATAWAAIGGYGTTTFVAFDTFRIAWNSSLGVTVDPVARTDTSWNYTIFATDYPIYTPAPGGAWAPINPNDIMKVTFGGVSPAGRANQLVTIGLSVSYAWVEVNHIAGPTPLTHPSAFTFTLLQAGA